MSRKPRKRSGRKAGNRTETVEQWNAAEADSLRSDAAKYLRHLEAVHYSAETASVRRRNLCYFFRWCDDRAFRKAGELDRAAIEQYQRHVFRYLKPDGKPLAVATQISRLYVVKDYLRYLARRYVIAYNPAAELQMPKQSVRIPRQTFSADDVEVVMDGPNLNTPEGLRDRAILELFYSTGIRRQELARLSIYDLDFSRNILMIRKGKGRKDRVVPVGDRAFRWIRNYLDKGRPQLLYLGDEITLFLSNAGEPMSRNTISTNVRRYIDLADVGKTGSCHLFRHTVATLMLENGADLRYIQEMLGHADVKTTQIYTKVSIKQLQAVHRLTHPTSVDRPKD